MAFTIQTPRRGKENHERREKIVRNLKGGKRYIGEDIARPEEIPPEPHRELAKKKDIQKDKKSQAQLRAKSPEAPTTVQLLGGCLEMRRGVKSC